jgi:archaellum component FlaC
MNIEEILKSRIAPPCQNIMFPNPHSFFSPFQEERQRQEQWRQQQHPYQYQPMIHIPKKTTAATIGEVGASVDMMRAQLTELSRRMEGMESKFSEFKNSVSNDIYLLKSTLSEHATEVLNVRDCVEDTRTHVKKTKELIEWQDNCVDNLADALRRQNNCLHKKQQQQKKNVASNVGLGIIRRRLSKVEDFINEFYEQFENFKSVKEIITGLSDHINECDQDISSFVVKRSENLEYVNTDAANGFNKNDEYDTNNLVIFMKEEHNQCDEDDFEYFEPIKKD